MDFKDTIVQLTERIRKQKEELIKVKEELTTKEKDNKKVMIKK